MARILLVNELGLGLGHVARLRPIAEALIRRGHQPVIVLPNPVEAFPRIDGSGIPVIQGPLAKGPERRLPQGFSIASFADMLTLLGFDSEAALRPRVEIWRHLFEQLAPAAIVADYSPTACLAAFGDWPTVVVGDGFTQPPTHRPAFPPLREGEELASQPLLLATVQTTQRRLGRAVPERLPEVIRGADRFVCTLRGLDPYDGMRAADEIVAPLEALPPPAAMAAEPRFFAYLAGEYPALAPAAEGLLATGLPGAAYIRFCPPPVAALFAGRADVTLHAAPQPLVAALAACTVFVHHGGQSSTLSALAVGRPQVVLDRYLEQALTGRRLSRLGLGARLQRSGLTAERVREAVIAAAADGPLRIRSRETAERLAGSGLTGRVEAIADRVAELAGQRTLAAR